MLGNKKDKGIFGVGNKLNKSHHNVGVKFNPVGTSPQIATTNHNVIDNHSSNSIETVKMPLGLNKHVSNKTIKSKLEKH
jgi:hypothetical protein